MRAGSRKLIGSDEVPRGRIEADGDLLITTPAASLWRVTMKLTPSYTVKHLILLPCFKLGKEPPAHTSYLSRGGGESQKPWVAL